MTTSTPRSVEPGDPGRHSRDTQPGAPRSRRRDRGGRGQGGPAVPQSPASDNTAAAGPSEPECPAPADPTRQQVVPSGTDTPIAQSAHNARADDRAELPVLTGGTFSTEQLTPQDWHDTRATNDDDTLRRSLIWSWSKALQRLIIVAGGVVLYMLAAVAWARWVPGATTADAMKVAGAAVAVGSGGLAVSAVREWLRRRNRR